MLPHRIQARRNSTKHSAHVGVASPTNDTRHHNELSACVKRRRATRRHGKLGKKRCFGKGRRRLSLSTQTRVSTQTSPLCPRTVSSKNSLNYEPQSNGQLHAAAAPSLGKGTPYSLELKLDRSIKKFTPPATNRIPTSSRTCSWA